jgi:beta-glucosidase-like glycosyl hydrolase
MMIPSWFDQRSNSSWMRMIARALISGGLSVVVNVALLAQTLVTQARSGIADTRLDARVEAILDRMTPEEKIGQLVQYSAGQPTGPGTGRTDYDDMIVRGQIGSLFNVVDPHEINKYQKTAMEKSRLHIPILFGLDVIHGFKTEFPIPLGLASTWDPAIVEKASRVAAIEASADGIRWTFSPMVDIARDARWGRMAEGAGEDPFLGSAMAAAYVRGYQGARLDAPDSLAACAKHYVGYGAAEAGRDYNTTEISEHTLRQFYLPPFHAAVAAGTASLMSAFNSLNGIPSTANPFTLKQILRKEWGFRGLVVSDWNAVGELIPHGIAADGATAARRAFLAGVDMDMVSSLYHDHLQQIISSGEAKQAELDEAVRHVLRVKLALGLFEHPFVDESAAAKALYHPESIALAQTAAERSFVLLKNANGPAGKPLLPLAGGIENVAVIGPLADDSSYPGGAPEGAGPRLSLPAALAQRVGADHVFRLKGVGGRSKGGPGHFDAGGKSGHERGGRFARASGTSRKAAGIIGGDRSHGKAGCSDPVQWTPPDRSLGLRTCARSPGGLASWNRRRTGTREDAFRRCESQRKAGGQLAAQRRARASLLQPSQHRASGGRHRTHSPAE